MHRTTKALTLITLAAILSSGMAFAEDHHDNHQYVKHDEWKKGAHMRHEDWDRGRRRRLQAVSPAPPPERLRMAHG